MIDAINKNNKVFIEAMDKMNVTQIEIEYYRSKTHEHSAKQHLTFLKERNKKMSKRNKNMVSVLANLSTTMCHVFYS